MQKIRFVYLTNVVIILIQQNTTKYSYYNKNNHFYNFHANILIIISIQILNSTFRQNIALTLRFLQIINN